jgi:hypothetical protein
MIFPQGINTGENMDKRCIFIQKGKDLVRKCLYGINLFPLAILEANFVFGRHFHGHFLCLSPLRAPARYH